MQQTKRVGDWRQEGAVTILVSGILIVNGFLGITVGRRHEREHVEGDVCLSPGPSYVATTGASLIY
jgi:hypothetical protein